MKTLITGHAGFVGRHLQKLLNAVPFSRGDGQGIDIRDRAATQDFIQHVKPDVVVHLAAQSHVADAMKDPQGTFEVNFQGTFHLLSALKDAGFRGRLLYVSSGDVYGLVQTLPVKEDAVLKPRNPYAVSKVAAEALCYQWSQTGPFEIVIARPFNHIGPGQKPSFSVAGFARQISAIKKNQQQPIVEVGDIDVTRDFTDVRDIAYAYQLLIEKGKNAEIYNICSGMERSLRSILVELLECAAVQSAIVPVSDRMRPVEQRRMCGSFEKLNLHTGWIPRIPFKQTLKDILLDSEQTS